ncbi:MAG: helix-turn-helix transcriptional regulator [Acidobacteriota bacterium]
MEHERRTSEDQVGEVLRSRREAAGLSKSRLAELTGLDRATLRAGEQGQDARASTLEAYLLALPELSPAELFPEIPVRRPPSSEGAWRHVKDARLLRCDAIERSVRRGDDGRLRCSLETRGLRQGRADLDDPAHRLRLMRIASRASGDLALRLAELVSGWRGEETRVDDAGVEHVFWVDGSGRTPSFGHRSTRVVEPRTGSRNPGLPALATGCHVSVHVPCRELTLRLMAPELDEAEARLLTWPHALVPDGLDDDLSSLTHPEDDVAITRGGEGELVARVRHPLVGLDHGLAAGPELVSTPRRRRPRSTVKVDLAGRLRRVRERSGHSARSLADAMGRSAMTVLRAEGGRDPQRSSLVGYLQALPELSAWELFAVTARRAVTRRAAWAHYRDLCNCEADEQVKLIVIARSGSSRISISTEGFRWLGPTDRDLSLRLGLGRSALQATRAELQSIDATSRQEALRIRRVPGLLAGQEQLLRVPFGLARDGVSFSRRLSHANFFSLTAARARERMGREGPYREGATFGPILPSRRLRLVVRFPRGHAPHEPRGHAWLTPDQPDSDRPGLERRLYPEGLVPEWDGRELSLSTEASMPGVKLGLSWGLPD